VEAIRNAAVDVLDAHGRQALQYSTTEGHAPLRAKLAAGLPGADADRILVTAGSQQGLDLVARVMLDPGDAVAVAAPTYMGALRAFDAYEARYLSVPSDEHGMLLDPLEAALRQRPKLLYVIPDFDNPGGTTTALERRHAMLDLADRYGVLVFEDAPYRELRFEGEPLPTLYELAPDRVVHAATFSKTMVPGIRLGWLTGPRPVIERATYAKQAADLQTATLTQMIADAWLGSGAWDAQLDRVRTYYRGQRDAMLAALERSMPAGVLWTRPTGGMFVWVTLPEGLDATRLVERAVAKGVAYVPGAPFFAAGGGENTLRLSYSVATREQIDRGIGTLGDVVAEAVSGVGA
jgi:2-aminoadipate transaminase